MAYLIPGNLGSRSDVSKAVQDVASALRDFVEDDVTVVYDVDRSDSPLVVIDPSAGVLAIHVVEGGARGLKRGFFARLRDVEPTLDELRRQIPSEAYDVLDRVSGSQHVQRDIPVAAALAAPLVSRAQASRQGMQPDGVLLEHDIRADRLRDAMARILGGRITPLHERDERAVRAAITPEIVIRDTADDESVSGKLVFRAPAVGDAIAVLDRQQQNLAMHLGDGYRVIRGVAGSGKTLVLTHRARHLATANPKLRLLVTCFNIALGKGIASQLADVPNVDVMHIDSFAYRVCRAAGHRSFKGDDRWLQQRQAAAKALEAGKDLERYDVVLVDEGQDFDNAAFDVAYAALKPESDEFVVALDAAQNIYRKRGRWNPPGTTARGRTTVMRVNYRNTKEILELAYGLLSRGGEVTAGEGGIDDLHVVVPPEATSRRGKSPSVVQISDWRDEARIVCDQLEQLHRDGTKWSDMVVLYGGRRVAKRLYRATESRGIPYFDVSFAKNKKEVMTCGDVVRGATLQTMKGLESSHVLICGVNDIFVGPGEDDDQIARRRLVYVGMTRATDSLDIYVAGEGAIGADILAAAQ